MKTDIAAAKHADLGCGFWTLTAVRQARAEADGPVSATDLP
jgi:hypothetical protein